MATIDDLPRDLIANIFHCLPIKTIGLCMCVNKPWQSIIKHPSFVSANTVIHNYKSNRNQYSVFWTSPRVWQLYIDSIDKFEIHSILTLPVGVRSDDTAISLCNGVLCFTKHNGTTVMLWNPTIQKLVTLPKANFIKYCADYYTLGFGFDSLTNDYKVVRILCFYKRTPQVGIFSLTSYSWKQVSGNVPCYNFQGPSLPMLDGVLHWIGYRGPMMDFFIVGFDVNAEVFRETQLPKGLKHRPTSLRLALYKQSFIALCCCDMIPGAKYWPNVGHFVDQDLEVWVMKEYGCVKSWTKIWKLSTAQLPSSVRSNEASIVGLRTKGEVIYKVFLNGRFNDLMTISIDTESGEEKQVALTREGGLFSYRGSRYFEESLVLLDNVTAITWVTRPVKTVIIEWKL